MINILIAIVVLLIISSMVQLVRVGELISQLENKDTNIVTQKDNKTQARILLIVGFLFIGSVIWQILEWGHFILPPASSVHGSEIDTLMHFTLILILIVFFITMPILFLFAYKYRGRKGNVAYYYAHNNKLEIIWTVIPTIVLTGFIIFGLKTWDKAMNVDTTDDQVIEIYGQGIGKWGWTARYSGEDNILGLSNFRMAERFENDTLIINEGNKLGVDMEDPYALDDKITSEVHLVVDRPVVLKFRSRDVIHSAYLPHFRVQMNCVPGMTTQFAFTPTQTTKEMKQQEGEDFEYILLCNKICGFGHFNMQMKFVVETQEEYDDWIASQKTLSEELLTQK